MALPPCPQEPTLEVITGFITQGTDIGPGVLDAGITMDILDPTEHDEQVRIIETADRFSVVVDWCICGAFASVICGCWCVQLYIDDIDGVGPTSGLLDSATVDVATGTLDQGDDTATRCYEHRFEIPAGRVGAGLYDLVAVVTLAGGSCAQPGRLVQDTLGFAEIPVVAFFDDLADFCPQPPPVVE